MGDTYAVYHDNPLDVGSSRGVLANDTDADGDPLTASLLVGGPMHGALTLDADGGFRYTPATSHVGIDAFSYRAFDGVDYSSPMIVTINVVNTAPTAVDDRYRAVAGTPLVVDADWGVLANDRDDSDPITAVLVFSPQYGTLALNPDGSFTYTPGTSFTGFDSFTYRALDNAGSYGTATVWLSPNYAARDDAYTSPHNQTLTVSADEGVLWNDDYYGSTAPVAILVTAPVHGTLTLNADGSFVYTPQTGYIGSDQFMYQTDVGPGMSIQAVVKITLTNDAPVGVDDSYTVAANTPLVVNTAAGLLANDFDPEGDTLSVVLDQAPAHGTLTLNSNGSFTYTPNAGYSGSDLFTYKLTDGDKFCSFAIPVKLAFAQVVAPAFTFNGLIRYDVAGGSPKPVREAIVALEARGRFGFRELSRSFTADDGSYSLPV